MNGYLPLVLASVLYTWQAALYLRDGDAGMAYAFWSYTHANLGFIYSILQRQQ